MNKNSLLNQIYICPIGADGVQEVEQRHQIKVISIITLENLIEYLEKIPSMSENLDKIRQYREAYGVIEN